MLRCWFAQSIAACAAAGGGSGRPVGAPGAFAHFERNGRRQLAQRRSIVVAHQGDLDPVALGKVCAAPGELEAVLRAAGFSDFVIESREVMFDFDSLDMHWQVITDMSPPARNAAQSLGPADLARLKRTLAEALSPYRRGERVCVPNTALCASGS